MNSADRGLYRYEWLGLGLLALGLVAFGGMVLLRSAFQQARKTDAGVYFRAADAIRKGQDIYALTTCDDNGWHYCYPPTFAIFMVPLADPFRWEDRTGYLPYWVSVAIWYLVSLGFLGYSLDRFAAIALPEPRRWSRRWWYARLVPFYITVGGVGFTLARGQVNLLLVALVAGAYAATMRGQLLRAGWWFAAAITLKVIPAYLLLLPFIRREWRTAFGLVLGFAVLVVALPTAVWGWQGQIDNHLVFIDAVLAPGAIGTGDQTRSKELTNTTATDSQSFQAVLHNLRHPEKASRPANADGLTKAVHLGLSGLVTLVLFLVPVVRGIRPEPAEQLIYLGCLLVAMLHITPVSHVHYYALGIPLVAGLWLQGLRDRPTRLTASPTTMVVLIAWGTIIALVLFPYTWTTALRDFGGGVLATGLLGAYGLMRCMKESPRQAFIKSTRDVTSNA
ncbi:MAG: glycosyltransferase family 87 protein [Fimbriiglobus sp.]